jgi:hypothetical protein
VARYADACNLFDIPDGGVTIARKLDVLRRHCADVGRPYGEIEKTLSTRLGPDESSEAFVQRCSRAGEHGIEHLVVGSSTAWTADAIGTLGGAIARLG